MKYKILQDLIILFVIICFTNNNSFKECTKLFTNPPYSSPNYPTDPFFDPLVSNFLDKIEYQRS